MADDATPPRPSSRVAKPAGAAPESPPSGAASLSPWQALIAAQAAMPDVPKSRTAKVRGVSKKTGKEYEMTYKYADISDVLSIARPHMAKHGFAIVQTTHISEAGVMALRTELIHASGERVLSEEYPVAHIREIDPQTIGAALTYSRRYQLCALLGIAPDEDTDGVGGESSNQEAKITAAQLKQLQGAFDATGRDVERACRVWGIESLPDLPARHFAEALAAASKPKEGA